jgi:protein-S-isoprenylcysteine O-methyltransferase Ste14
MTDDERFRWILLAGLLVVMPVALYFRLRSHTGERLDRWQEGWYILFPLRLLGLVSIAGVIAFVIQPRSMAWASLPLPTWLRWVGVGLGICAAGLVIWTFRNLGKNLTDTVVTRERHTLVTTGPYQWVRHPFYTAFALAVAANALTTANWFLLATGAAAWTLVAIRTHREEANLLLRFGDDYRRYRERTGKFLPRLISRRAAHD